MVKDRASVLARLAEELAQESTEVATGTAITERALAYVPDADAVSVTVNARRDRHLTLAASNETSRLLDELQYTLGEGPCVDAADGHDWCRSGQVGDDPRWPRWAKEAQRLGVGSLLSVGLLSRGTRIGALNFYAGSAGRFSDRDEVDFAILYAAHVAIALAASRQISGLETALHSRHRIGVAQGILVERFGLTMEQSFDLLRRCSSTTNTKLATVAEEIVRTGQLPELPGSTPEEQPVSC